MTIEPKEATNKAAEDHDAYAAWRCRDFRLYLAGNVVAVLGMQMQSVAVGWEIYERTASPLALGLTGLVQVLPAIPLALVAGHVADRFDRKRIVALAYAVMAASSALLAVISFARGPVPAMFGCLLLSGIARAFQQPAKASLLPRIVPRAVFSNAISWHMGGFQLASVLGPALGGMLIAIFRDAVIVYACDAAAAIVFLLTLSVMRGGGEVSTAMPMSRGSLAAGLAFVWRNKVILGAMSVDMFAVLLGGATALLPIFAKDILRVGPSGLGWLQAAPATGALAMSVGLAHRKPIERAGRALLLAVTGFGLATLVFGLSRLFWLSLTALVIAGACDTVSVVIRHTLVQMLTPDRMRGRVSAVNGMFIGASNELGGFESGLVAHLFTAVISVVSGGIGTLLVVAIAALLLPQLRRYGSLNAPPPEAAEPSLA